MLGARDDLKPRMVFLLQRGFKYASGKLPGPPSSLYCLNLNKDGLSALASLFIFCLPIGLGFSPLSEQPKPGMFSYTGEALNCNFH